MTIAVTSVQKPTPHKHANRGPEHTHLIVHVGRLPDPSVLLCADETCHQPEVIDGACDHHAEEWGLLE